jgi:hypothetical protein
MKTRLGLPHLCQHAFREMLDLNLTPMEWKTVEAKTEVTAELMRLAGQSPGIISGGGMQKVRVMEPPSCG